MHVPAYEIGRSRWFLEDGGEPPPMLVVRGRWADAQVPIRISLLARGDLMADKDAHPPRMDEAQAGDVEMRDVISR